MVLHADVAFVDLGDAAFVLLGGIAAPRRELRNNLIDGGAYEAGVSALTEPDLAGDLGNDEPHPARLLAVAL